MPGTLASPNLPKSTCRHGLSLLMEPQNDFFLTPTSVNVAFVGNFVPDISTEAALRHVNLRASGPFEVAPAALGLLVSHRIPLGLRHRDLDRDHVVERIKRIECLLLFGAHRDVPSCSCFVNYREGMPGSTRRTRVVRYPSPQKVASH